MTLQYVLTTDITFQAGKIYYTRSGAGTASSPYTYTQATVTVGATIPVNTYYELSSPTTYTSIRWLPEDLTGKASTNFVQNEVHKSETTGSLSRFVIIPTEGAFYDTDNLKVVYHTSTSDSVLIRDNDYRLVGIDFGRTKVSAAQGGVYHFILITTVFNYDPSSYITIDYQAFGGYMSARAYTDLLTAINNLESKLQREGIITADNIASNDTIRTLTVQLQALCSRVQYAPSIKYLAKCSHDTDIVWQTFATSSESYDNYINFNIESTLKGVAVFNFISPWLTMKVALEYDLAQKYPNKIEVFNGKVKANVLYQEINQYQHDLPVNDATFFKQGRMYIPKFRIAFNSENGAKKKVMLQMAIASNKEQNLEFIITDATELGIDDIATSYVLTTDAVFIVDKQYYIRTGSDAYYRYKKATVTPGATIPAGTYYVIASVNMVHNASLSTRFDLTPRSESVEPPSLDPALTTSNFTQASLALKEPFKIWEGNVNLVMVQGMSYTKPYATEEYNTYDKLVPLRTDTGYWAKPFCPHECLDASIINYFVVDVYDRFDQRIIRTKFPASIANPYAITTTNVPKKTFGTGVYFMRDMGIIELVLELVGANANLYVYSKIGRCSIINKRFDLRAVYIY